MSAYRQQQPFQCALMATGYRCFPFPGGLLFFRLLLKVILLVGIAEMANATQVGFIVYGSYGRQETAESARILLETRVLEPLEILESRVNGISRFRIVGRAYEDLMLVREKLDTVKSTSTPDAWLLIEEHGDPEWAEEQSLEAVTESEFDDDFIMWARSEQGTSLKPRNSPEQLLQRAQQSRLTRRQSSIGVEDIALFRITNAQGEFSSQALYEGMDTRHGGIESENQTQLNLRQTLSMRLSSYLYHPNLVSLDLRGGPIYESSFFEQDNLSNDKREMNFALAAYATFLREKPYRGLLFFDKSYPTIRVNIGETATTDNLKYGGGFDLLAPLVPVPLHFDASSQEIATRSSQRSSLQQIDRIKFRGSASIGNYGSTILNMHSTRQATRSENPGLPAQESSFENQGFDLETRLRFGVDQEYSLVNSIVAMDQQANLSLGEIPDRRERRISLDLRRGLPEGSRSFASMLHEDDLGPLNRSFDRINIGATYNPDENWSLAGGAQFEKANSLQLDNQSYGINGALNYQHDLPIGSATFHYRLSEERRSQNQKDANLDIVGEQVTLNGVTAIALSQPRVFADSIRVNDLTRTREFIEGVDYNILVVGIETRLQRLVSGDIGPDEPLLVDYTVEVGGSFNSNHTEQGLSAIWHISPYLEIQYQGNFSMPKVTDGDPAFELNRIYSHLGTIRTDWPIPGLGDLQVGGRAEYENRNETIDSYTRTSLELYTQGSLPLLQATSLRAGLRRTTIDHVDSGGNVDLSAIDFNLLARHRYNGTLSLNLSYEQDIGGSTTQERLVAAIRAQARFQRITLTAELAHTREQQQDFNRSRTHVFAELRREFF